MNVPNQKKKKIDVSVESMKDLMQETYNEIVDERNKAITAYKKFSKDINENSDIALVGKITNDLLKIIDGTIEKKLRLIKIQGDILYKNGKAGGDASAPVTITEEDRKWAEEFIKRQAVSSDDNEKEYE
jgi:Cys-tRNA synthase (O-phospho-L-seryl-tRNA:Cys-tRNA synthase)